MPSSESERLLLVRTFVQLQGGGPIPPLGLLTIGGAIRRAFGERYDLSLVDMGAYPRDGRPVALSPRDLVPILEQQRPDIVGLSAMTCEAGTMAEVARIVREVLPDCFIVMGGAHTHAGRERILAEVPALDVVVMGEGDETIIDLLRARQEGTPLAEVPGLVIRGSEGPVLTASRPLVADLDSLADPAWDLVDLPLYGDIPNWNGMKKAPFHAPIVTMRGCPFQCTFCHQVFGKTTRAHSPERVIAHMRYLHDDLGVREFHVVDDIFNMHAAHASAVLRGILDSGMKVALAFPNGLRADVMTDEVLDLLQRAGTYKVHYGFETTSPRLQKLIKKNLKIERTQEIIERTSRMGIVTGAYFMLGFPTETRQEALDTIDYAVRSPLDVAYFFKATAYPGTELGDAVVPETPDWSAWHFFSVERSHGEGTAAEVNSLILYAQQRFFLQPRRLWRVFWKVPRKLDFIGNLAKVAALMLQGFMLRQLQPADRP